MAAHLTAEAVASALARRRTTSALDALAGIDEREHEAVADALAGVSPKAKIDVPLLVRTIRDRLRARDEAEEARRAEQADPFGYSLSLMSLDELHALKRALEGGATVEEAMVAARRSPCARAHAEDREEPDEEEPDEEPTPRRRIARRRPRASHTEPPAAAHAVTETRRTLFGSRVVGAHDPARPYGCPDGADYEAWKSPGRPPWLITDGDADNETTADH